MSSSPYMRSGRWFRIPAHCVPRSRLTDLHRSFREGRIAPFSAGNRIPATSPDTAESQRLQSISTSYISSRSSFSFFSCIKTNVRVVTVTAARWCVVGVWLTGFLLALYPVFHWPQPSFYSSNGLCFPLHIDDPFTLGWQYSALVFLGINLAAVSIDSSDFEFLSVNVPP